MPPADDRYPSFDDHVEKDPFVFLPFMVHTPLPILDETVDTIYGLYLMSTVFLGAYSQLAVRPAFPRNDAGCIKILSNVRRL
jgi:hypothetical protein